MISDNKLQLLRLPALPVFSKAMQEMNPTRTTQLWIPDRLQMWTKMVIISRHPLLRGQRYSDEQRQVNARPPHRQIQGSVHPMSQTVGAHKS
jgi:hypothetical protein